LDNHLEFNGLALIFLQLASPDGRNDMKSSILSTALLLITLQWAGAQSISITDISPSPPSTLEFDEQVTISYEYSLPNSEGARIFIRPVTSGRLASNYAASGSPIYRGSGRAQANFTIKSGNVTVDQLRVRVVSPNQNRLLFEFFVPVDFTFSSSKPYIFLNPQKVNPKILEVQPQETKPDTSFTGFYEIPEDAEVVKRVVKPDGTIETYYSEGSIEGITPNNITYRINPATGDTTFMQMLAIEVQKASPPGFVATSNTEVNQEWLSSLNAWIKYHGNRLLDRIQFLLQDEESFKNYRQFEEENSDTIYEQVNLRYTFLVKLSQLEDIPTE
jgi:hypothetical protein